MPYTRGGRSNTRSFYRRKRGGRNRGNRTAYGRANYAVKLARKAMRTELKYLDVAISDTPSTTGTVIPLSGTAQGDTSQSRDGLQIFPTSIEMRLNFSFNASATASVIRVVIYQYLAGVSSSVQNYFDASPTTTDFKAINQQYESRTLFDRTYSLNDLIPEKNIYLKRRIKGIIAYDGATATDIAKNGLYMILLSDEATNTPTVTGTARFFFKDN